MSVLSKSILDLLNFQTLLHTYSMAREMNDIFTTNFLHTKKLSRSLSDQRQIYNVIIILI